MKTGKKQPVTGAAKAARGPRKPGPFKPKVSIPRQLPALASQPPAVATTSGHPPVLASEPGLLQRVGQEADEALAIGKRVLTMLNVEAKAIQYAVVYPGTSVLNSGQNYDPLTVISQGSTDAQRDGDSMKLKFWHGSLLFVRGGVDAIVSYIIVQEGPAFIGTGYNYLYQAIGTANAPLSQGNWDARFGFKILSHGVRSLTNNDPFWNVKFDHKFNHDVQYYNNTSVVYEGNVKLFVISNNAGGGSQPTVCFDTTLSWVDN